MKNQVLTKEQMEELIALGVDVSKASMCRVSVNLGTQATDESKLVENDVNYYGFRFEVFTVTDMLEMMPEYISDLDFDICKSGNDYICRYFDFVEKETRYESESKSFIEAVYGTFSKLVKAGKL